MNYLLGVDLGTSGTKTVLFDEDGNVVASKNDRIPAVSGKKRLGRAGAARLVERGGGYHSRRDHRKRRR